MRYLYLALVISIGALWYDTRPVVKPVKEIIVKEVMSKAAYANCVKEKESEVDHSTEASKRYSWKPEEIIEYCEENWRGYRD